MQLRLARPGFWMAVVLLLVALGIQVILATPLGILDVVFEEALKRPRPGLSREPAVIGCINLLGFGAAIALGLYLNRLPFRKAFPLGPFTAAQVATAWLLVLGTDIVLSEVDNLFRALLPPPQWLTNLLQDLFFRQDRLLSSLFLLVVVAPLTEELLFRGIILRGLLSRFRPWRAVLLTAFLFAALHFNPYQFASALLLGCAFGWLYVRTGSITLCMCAHAFSNALSAAFAALPWHIRGMTGSYMSTIEFQPWWLDLSGLVIVAAGIWAFHRAAPWTETNELAAPPVITPGRGFAT